MQAAHAFRGSGEQQMTALNRRPCLQSGDLFGWRDRHLVQRRGLTHLAVDGQGEMQPLCGVDQGVPA